MTSLKPPAKTLVLTAAALATLLWSGAGTALGPIGADDALAAAKPGSPGMEQGPAHDVPDTINETVRRALDTLNETVKAAQQKLDDLQRQLQDEFQKLNDTAGSSQDEAQKLPEGRRGPDILEATLSPGRPTHADGSVKVSVRLADPNGIGGGVLYYNHTFDDAGDARVNLTEGPAGSWVAHIPGPFADGDTYAGWIFVWDASRVGQAMANEALAPLRSPRGPPLPGTNATDLAPFSIPDTTRPTILEDQTPPEVEAGASLPVRARIEDNIGVTKAEVHLRGDAGTFTVQLAAQGGAWQADVRLGLEADPVEYALDAFDAAGNRAGTGWKVVRVLDLHPPTVSLDDPAGRARWGDRVTVYADAEDQVGVVEVTLMVVPLGRPAERIAMSKNGAEWSASFEVPSDVDELRLWAEARDAAGHVTRSDERTLGVDALPAGSRAPVPDVADAPQDHGRDQKKTPGVSALGLLLAGLATIVLVRRRR